MRLPSSLSSRCPMRRAAALSLVLLVAVAFPFATQRPAAAADPVAPTARLTAAELDQLVAPVALYPDIVLDSLLPATAAPADVASAAQYLAARGGAVEVAPEDSSWDSSVVALLQFPDVLRWMSENPGWVEQMGFAVSVQQPEVLAAIQRYRARARDAGALVTNSYETVTTEAAAPSGVTYIVIQSIQPDVVYVPVYDPWLVFQPGFVYAPSRPFFTSWFGFRFGLFGAWAWHDISWGFGNAGIYYYSSPWWSARRRSPSTWWGVNRPILWRAPFQADRPWFRRDWRPTATSFRPALPTWDLRARGTQIRSVIVRPPTIRPDLRVQRQIVPTRPAWTSSPNPPVPVTSPIPRPVRPIPPTWRTPVPQPLPQPVPTAPRVQFGPVPWGTRTTVTDRSTVDAWTRRGFGSLQENPVFVPVPRSIPVPVVPPPVIQAPLPPPTRTEGRWIAPPRPAPSLVPGQRVRVYDARGRRSLGSS